MLLLPKFRIVILIRVIIQRTKICGWRSRILIIMRIVMIILIVTTIIYLDAFFHERKKDLSLDSGKCVSTVKLHFKLFRIPFQFLSFCAHGSVVVSLKDPWFCAHGSVVFHVQGTATSHPMRRRESLAEVWFAEMFGSLP